MCRGSVSEITGTSYQGLTLEFLISVSCLEKSFSLHLLRSYKFYILFNVYI